MPGRCGVSPLERVESDEVRTRGKLPPLYYGLLLPKEDNSTKATNCQVSYSYARNDVRGECSRTASGSIAEAKRSCALRNDINWDFFSLLSSLHFVLTTGLNHAKNKFLSRYSPYVVIVSRLKCYLSPPETF